MQARYGSVIRPAGECARSFSLVELPSHASSVAAQNRSGNCFSPRTFSTGSGQAAIMNTGAFASLKRTQSPLQYEGKAGGAPRLTARACSACVASAAIASDKCGGGRRGGAPSIAVQVTSAAKAAKSRSAEQSCK